LVDHYPITQIILTLRLNSQQFHKQRIALSKGEYQQSLPQTQLGFLKISRHELDNFVNADSQRGPTIHQNSDDSGMYQFIIENVRLLFFSIIGIIHMRSVVRIMKL
jgi:hypothetical protein